MLQCTSVSIYPNSPMCPPSSVNSTGFMLQPTSDSRQWYWPSKLSTELHPSTSKHWSDDTHQHKHFTPLHQLAVWHCHSWEQTKVAQLGHDSCSGPSVVEHTPNWCQDSRVTCHLWQKTQDSLVQTLPHSCIAWCPSSPDWLFFFSSFWIQNNCMVNLF